MKASAATRRVALLLLLLVVRSLLLLPFSGGLFFVVAVDAADNARSVANLRRPTIESFTLVDATTQSTLGKLVNGTQINVALTGNQLGIQAHVQGLVRRIQLLVVELDGREQFRFAPTLLHLLRPHGQSMVRYGRVPTLSTLGLHNITATVHSRIRGQYGQVAFSVIVNVIDKNIPQPPTKVPQQAPPVPLSTTPLSPPPPPPSLAKAMSKCGGAVNTGWNENGINKCESDLYTPTGDDTMHCFAYGGNSDPCSLNNNNDVNHGLDKNPAHCKRGDTFYLWDEPDTQGKNYTWAGLEWAKYANRFATELLTLRQQRNVQVTSPLVRAGESGAIAARLEAFYTACGKGCRDPNSAAYIHVNAVNAFCGPWNKAGVQGCREAAQFIAQEVSAVYKAGENQRPWYITNWSRLGTSNVSAQVDAMTALPMFFATGSPVQRVYWFGATDYGGGSSNNFLTTRVGSQTLGEIWKSSCDRL